jgi:hypothetical protein
MRLHLGRRQLVGRHLAGAGAQDAMPDGDDVADRHGSSRIGMRRPRSSATSIARG